MRPAVRALTLVAALGAAACSDDPESRIDVVVSEPVPGPMMIERIRVFAGPLEEGASARAVEVDAIYQSGRLRPVTHGLSPERAEHVGRALYRVRAEGVIGNEVVVVAQARIVFVPGSRIVLPLRFDNTCWMLDCEGNTTCQMGACIDDLVEPCGLEGAGSADFCRSARDAGRVDSAQSIPEAGADVRAPDAFAPDSAPDPALDSSVDSGIVPTDSGPPPPVDSGPPPPVDSGPPSPVDSGPPPPVDSGPPPPIDSGPPPPIDSGIDPPIDSGPPLLVDSGPPSCGSCDDGLDCTADDCVSGACVSTPATGFCAIAGFCRSAGETTINGCQICDPTRSATDWSPNAGGDCDDGDGCTVNDTCQTTGVCDGIPRACPVGRTCRCDLCLMPGDLCP